jgi:hypothetical protein
VQGGIATRRKTGQISLGGGLSFQLHRRMSMTWDVSYVDNRTNLPRDYIYNEAGTVVGIQAGNLSDYHAFRTSGTLQYQF